MVASSRMDNGMFLNRMLIVIILSLDSPVMLPDYRKYICNDQESNLLKEFIDFIGN